MAQIHLDWYELNCGELPMVCATCGDDADDQFDRKIEKRSIGFMCTIRRWTKVVLPFCRRHRTASWNGFLRPVARTFNDDGITLGQVSEDFVDAVWDWRDNPHKYRRRGMPAHVLPVGNGPGGARYDDDEYDDVDVRPRRRRSSGAGRILFGVAMTVLTVFVVGGCGMGIFIMAFFGRFGASTNQRPGVNRPGFNRPGFQRPGFNRPGFRGPNIGGPRFQPPRPPFPQGPGFQR